MSRRGKKHEQHVRLYQWEMRSPAFQSLSVDARALLVEFRALYTGRENRIHLSVREMMTRLNIGQRRAQAARDELLDRGFVRLLEKGSFSRRPRLASEYCLTNETLDSQPGPPPLDFMRWGRKKTSVAVATTDGSRSDYRADAAAAKKQPAGSRSDYRNARNSTVPGSRSDYTGRLPPPVGKELKAVAWGWEARGRIWRCRSGLILNTQCARCQVWITARREEFDGRRHRCGKTAQRPWTEDLDTMPGGWIN